MFRLIESKCLGKLIRWVAIAPCPHVIFRWLKKVAGFLVFLVCTSAYGGITEVKVKLASGVVYILPAFDTNAQGKVTPILADAFYVKDGQGNNIVITDMDVKASLYGISLMASNLAQENYWVLRNNAEQTYRALLETINQVREDDVDLKASAGGIAIAAGTSCAATAVFGATAATFVVPGLGTVTGAAAGCLIGGTTAVVASTVDEVLASAWRYWQSHNGNSREAIAHAEARDMLSQVYGLSSEIRTGAVRWLRNGAVIEVQEIVELADMEIGLSLLDDALDFYAKSMYPESEIIRQQSQSRVYGFYGYAANVVQALDVTNIWYNWGNFPVSTILELLDAGISFANGQETPEQASLRLRFAIEDRSDRRKEVRLALQDLSPLSDKNRAVNKALFEAREPVEYSGSYFTSPSNLVDVGQPITIKSTVQHLGVVYPTGVVNYEVFDPLGNSLFTGASVFASDGYYAGFNAPANPGSYTVVLRAKDAAGNEIGASQLRFSINNPAIGHDLSINTFSQSTVATRPGQSVVVSLGVRNVGLYSEVAKLSLQVSGPGGYSWFGPEVALGSILSGETKNFSAVATWPVPAGAIDGSYTIRALVLGPSGDITPIDNLAERFVYVGNYNVVTPTSMIGREFLAAYNSGVELKSLCDYPSTGYGGFGWVTYSRSGQSFAIAIGGLDDQGDRDGGKVCLVVRSGSSTGPIVYSSGGVRDRVGRPIYISGTPLIIFAALSDSNHMDVIVAEGFSGVGFDVRERTSIPALETEFNSKVGGINCSNNYSYIHQATVSSGGRWNFNVYWQLNDDIGYRLGVCNASGRQVFLSSSSVRKHYFVVEHRASSPPSGYSPTISGASTVFPDVFYWLTGILDVQNYVDVALALSAIADSYVGGSVNNLAVNVISQGTMAPSALDVVWTLIGPNDYKLETTISGGIGVNTLSWDTNGLPAGEYQVSAKVMALGDVDADDTVLSKTIILQAPPPTLVEQLAFPAPAVSASKGDRGIALKASSVGGKAGQRHRLVVALKDALGNCRQDGLVYAKQLSATSEPLGGAILTKVMTNCEFRGDLTLAEGATSVRVVGHLNRLDDGLLDIPATIGANLAPVAAIHHNYPSLIFLQPQTISLQSDAADPDGDGIVDLVWDIETPTGNKTSLRGQTTINLPINEPGKYLVSHYAIDGLGKQSDFVRAEVELLGVLVPGAPTNVTATARDSSAWVYFSPPSYDGGAPIEAYRATCGPSSAYGPTSPIEVTSLTNGVLYTCEVMAHNTAGWGPSSSASNGVTPLAPTAPSEPQRVVAMPANGTIAVRFDPPTFYGTEGGGGYAIITKYTATCGSHSQSTTGSFVPYIVFFGLTNGTYTCTVTATNSAGLTGPPGSAVAVAVATVPNAPTVILASPGNASGSITFFAPASDGGAAIDSYRATCSPGGIIATGSTSPLTVTGLANGTPYTCTLAAHNSQGWGSESGVSNPFTPSATSLVQRAFVSATSGSDANTANSCAVSTPCRTFAAAVGVVAPGGEVIAMSSGAYGAVTLSNSVSLIAAPGVYAGIMVFAGSGVTIATPGARIVLRGLSISGMGGNTGIEMDYGASLSVENCVISGFGAGGTGIYVGTGARLDVDRSIVADSSRGIFVEGGAAAAISRSRVLGSDAVGIWVYGNAPDRTTSAALTSVLVSGGAQGVLVEAGTGSLAQVQLTRSAIQDNSTGGLTKNHSGGVATAVTGRTRYSGNGVGLSNSGKSGSLRSTGNNFVSSNGVDVDGTITTEPLM